MERKLGKLCVCYSTSINTGQPEPCSPYLIVRILTRRTQRRRGRKDSSSLILNKLCVLCVFANFAFITLCLLIPCKEKAHPEWGGLFLKLKPGSDLLSHGETPHYHRRYTVSLLSSRWDQVVPVLYGRQVNWLKNRDRLCRSRSF